MTQTEQLLKELTEADGVPGYETEVRTIVREYMLPLGEIETDRVGSVVCRQGERGPRVMLAAHMDEVGFMVQHITKDGFVKFLPLGGWWDQVLLGHRVIIKTHDGPVLGVIGAKPPHVLPADERKKLVEKQDMYIDIGATSRDEVEKAGVRLGDPVVPAADFRVLSGGSTYLSKAFDDRVGIALIIETLQHFSHASHPNVLFGAATVMEEVGTRGAETSVEVVNPDVAIILEVDICGDVPGIKDEQSSTKLGHGPSLLLFDARMIPNLKLRDLIIDTAADLGIGLQLSTMAGGATDGSKVHLHGTGVPTVVLSVPTRHIHSHNGIMHRHDYDQLLELLKALLSELDADTVAGLTD